VVGPWNDWVNDLKRPGERYLVISVTMLPGGEPGVTFAEGAKGAYNSHFKILAENLVKYNLSSSIVRIGWEMNGGWYPWRASKDIPNWPLYWQQIVTTMRSVPGQHFKFNWNPTNGWQQEPADQVYPGDTYVDLIGIDIYDQIWDSKAPLYNFGYPQVGAWYSGIKFVVNDTTEYNGYWLCLKNNTGQVPQAGEYWKLLADTTVMTTSRKYAIDQYITGGYAVNYWIKFAQSHNKPMTINEWGVWNTRDGHGGGDDPMFIQTMYDFVTSNNVLFHSYFDVWAFDGNHELQPTQYPAFPQSAALFKKLFGGSQLNVSL